MLSITDFDTLKEILGHDVSIILRLQQLSKPNMLSRLSKPNILQQHYHFCGSLMLKWLKFTVKNSSVSLKLIPISEKPKCIQ